MSRPLFLVLASAVTMAGVLVAVVGATLAGAAPGLTPKDVAVDLVAAGPYTYDHITQDGTGPNLPHYPKACEILAIDLSPGMLDMARLRFLLADDAGAGKTIMAGLLVREMLLRRQVKRVLVVAPAGLVGNWESELRTLFRLRFRILGSGDASDGHNPFTAEVVEALRAAVRTPE